MCVRAVAPMVVTNVAEFACSGDVLIGTFQMLFGGKIWQPPTVGNASAIIGSQLISATISSGSCNRPDDAVRTRSPAIKAIPRLDVVATDRNIFRILGSGCARVIRQYAQQCSHRKTAGNIVVDRTRMRQDAMLLIGTR